MSAPFIGAVGQLAAAGSGAVRQCLGFVLKALAAANEVKLSYGGNPRTDGKTIWLPQLPYKAAAEFVEMVLGNLFHEVCHVRHTDFAVFLREVKAAENPGLVKGIANAIEDPRIEAVEQKVRPYYVARIHNARHHAANLGFVRKPDNEVNALLVYLVLWGHVGNGMVHARDALEEAEKVLREKLGDDTVNDLEQMLQVGFPRLTSTSDVFMLTHQIVSLIEQAANPPQPQPSIDENPDQGDESHEGEDGDGQSDPQQGEDESDTGGDPGDGEEDGESDGSSSGGSDSDGDDDGSDAGGSDNSGDQADPDASNSSSTGGGAGASQDDPKAQAAKRLLESEVENPGAAHTDIGKALEEEAEQAMRQQQYQTTTGNAGELVRQPISGDASHVYDRLRSDAAEQSEAVKRHFLALMTRARSRRMEPRNSGRIRPGKFVLATVGAKPFGRRAESLVRETAVELLVDVSGSMALGKKAVVAAQAAVAVVEACTAARLPVGVAAFEANSYYRLKGFDQVLVDAHGGLGTLPSLPDEGGTPLGEAIELSAMALLARPEARKMMFCVTDGAPNDRPHVEAMVAGLKGFIEVVGVGIGGHSCKGLFDDFITVQRIDDLGDELIDYLRNRVIATPRAA